MKPVPSRVPRIVLGACVVLLGLKVAFAAAVGLYFDEALYWQCGQRLAPAYGDHPFMTALLVRAGTALLGDTPLGVRMLFLVAGAALPCVVWGLARAVAGERRAWIAAGIAAVAPILGAQGVLAVPDTILAVLAAAVIAAVERATRTRSRGAWIAAGVFAALGFCTHYRFVLVVAAAGAYLVLTRAGRAHLRTPGPWIALAIASAGLTPILVFNVQHDFAPLRYQFFERHAEGEARGVRELLVHPIEQAAVVSPLLYAAMIASLVAAWRRGRAGDDRSALLATFATVPLAAYFVTSPFAGDELAHVHWPAWGYIPLCVLAAGTLEGLAGRGGWRRALAVAIPASAAAVWLAAAAALALDAFHVRARLAKFTDWTQVVQRVRARLPAAPPGERPIVVADSYVQASQLDFALGGAAEVFTLDHERNRHHGRSLQYRIWGLDEQGLRARAGRDVLVVVEESDMGLSDRAAWMEHVRAVIDGATPVNRRRIPTWPGEDPVVFVLLTGRVPER